MFGCLFNLLLDYIIGALIVSIISTLFIVGIVFLLGEQAFPPEYYPGVILVTSIILAIGSAKWFPDRIRRGLWLVALSMFIYVIPILMNNFGA